MKANMIATVVLAACMVGVMAGNYVVVLSPDMDQAAHVLDLLNNQTLLGAGGYVASVYYNAMYGYSVHTTNPAFVQMLNMEPGVVGIYEDAEVTLDDAWGLDRHNQFDLPLDADNTYCQDGTDVDVYVIDTGVAPHDEFGGRTEFAVNLVGDGIDTDCNSHGTHVMGTILSSMHGMAVNARGYAVKVFGCSGGAPFSRIIDAVEWVMNRVAETGRPSVINMSLGGGFYQPMNDAVEAAVAAGIHVVVSAGNSNDDACFYSPASAPSAITVGSTTIGDVRSSFSNYGQCVDIWAAGSGITSTVPGNGLGDKSGTSMASPHVAGAVALLLQDTPASTPAQMAAFLVSTSLKDKLADVAVNNRLLYLDDDYCEEEEEEEPPMPSCGAGENGSQYCVSDTQFLVCVWGIGYYLDTAAGTHCCQNGNWIYQQTNGVPC